VLAGTAELALGRGGAASASFERALAADPELELDERTVSPKVVRAFDETRKRVSQRGASGATQGSVSYTEPRP
jgi:hypothetical protein